MRFIINAIGLVAWAFSALLLFGGIADLSNYEEGSIEYMFASANADATLPLIGFGLLFGLGCFLVGALLKRRS